MESLNTRRDTVNPESASDGSNDIWTVWMHRARVPQEYVSVPLKEELKLLEIDRILPVLNHLLSTPSIARIIRMVSIR